MIIYTVSFTYTATGKRATMTDASGQTTYNYDNMDRLSSKITPEGTLSYTYDAAGNLASIASSNSNGASMSYSYDNLNRVSSVTDKLGTTTYTYDGASNLYTATYPNTVQAQYQACASWPCPFLAPSIPVCLIPTGTEFAGLATPRASGVESPTTRGLTFNPRIRLGL